MDQTETAVHQFADDLSRCSRGRCSRCPGGHGEIPRTAVPSTGPLSRLPSPSSTSTVTQGNTIREAVSATIDRALLPSITARAGSVRVVSVERGVVTLEADGSPGAIMPTVARIRTLLRAAVPEIVDVKITWPGATDERSDGDDFTARVQLVLDTEINRAVAAHGGHVALVDAVNGRVRLRLEGGCQGCSLAEVTLRQGIEPILRNRVREVAAVVDVTDHAAETAPFFAPGKR